MPIPSTPAVERSFLRETAFERLRDAIVDGTLEPGERLRDAELEAWLGVSRTPIREAILELRRSGLVVAKAGSATVVSPIDATATRNAQAVAAALHTLAAQTAVGRLDANHIDALDAANRRFAAALNASDVDAALEADDDFHGILVTAAGNPVLAAHVAQVTPLLRRVERIRFASLASRESVAQHAAIVDACRRGDAAEAGRLSAANWHTLDDHLT
jgi:DNA-binding GntR family transcriptional regulator